MSDEEAKGKFKDGQMGTPNGSKDHTGDATCTISKESTEEEERGHWDNQVQFLLTCIGLAVGLGNIWKFPILAFNNGGSAFLFPYITCSLVFGLPMVYCEFLIGQYLQAGPGKAFKKLAPGLQGVGWGMAIIAGTVSIFYTVVIAWAGVYMAFIVSGQSSSWTVCDNSWNNNLTCINNDLNDVCYNASLTDDSVWNGIYPYEEIENETVVFSNYTRHYNGSCIRPNSTAGRSMELAAEQFFKYYVVKASSGITDFGGVNWPTFASLVVMWLIVIVTLIKGIEIMGKASYVTATVPYVIIAILFVRGVTLEGAETGIQYYLGKPQWEKILTPQVWKNAIMQVCFSIAIGYGALIALSSFSKRDNNCFRDACIVIGGDTFMSVFGGVAVFSTMGFLAKTVHRRIEDVIAGGPQLAFVVYPEAIARMPIPPLFAMLFFLMLFCLGISTEVALVEVLINCIDEQFPKIGKRRWILVISVCLCYMSMGLIMTTGTPGMYLQCGWYWFNIYNEFTGTTAAVVIAMIEAIAMGWIYGIDNVAKDIERIFGAAPKNVFLRMIGPHSPYLRWMWRTVCPAAALIIAVITCFRERMTEGDYVYPIWAELFGWFLAVCPLIAIPIFFFFNAREMKKNDKDFQWQDLFRVTTEHPSYKRIHGEEEKEREEERWKGKSGSSDEGCSNGQEDRDAVV